MRSIPLLAATTVILATAWSCGGGGTDVNVPVANFSVGACTAGTACQFTNTSTPTTGLTYEWTFSDTPTKVTDPSPSHTFATPGDYTVSLKVTDASGATNTKTSTVTVAAGTNTPPVASFDLPASCTAGTPCGFHSTSTDPDVGGTIAGSHWDFGDPTSANNTADTPDATHTFAASGTYNVTLTVTDDKGGTSTPVIKALTVTPAASQGCTTTTQGTVRVVNCTVGITQTGQVKITLLSRNCELGGNTVRITGPLPAVPVQTAFTNLCFRPEGESYIVKDAAGAPLVFQAGSTLGIQFRQGTADPGDPVTGDPGITTRGSFPNLTLNVDDGGAPGTQGEPDFNDAILLVQPGP
jgi:PKD repeat protein